MISSFNIEKLTGMLKDFYTLTHIRITVFNEYFQEIASYPPDRSEVCQLIRRDREAAERCRKNDETACKIAASRRGIYIYKCHAGLKEAIIPIYLSNIVIGYLFFGHVFLYPSHEEGWKVIEEKCSCYSCNKEELKDACFRQPLISEEYMTSAASMMNAVASYLCYERMVSLKSEPLPVQIDSYIHDHLTEDIDVSVICRRFGIGKTRLYEIAKESYGTGIAERIRSLRIEKAKTLLAAQPELSVAEVSEQCGFKDYNYFITVFHRETGMTPRRYLTTAVRSRTSRKKRPMPGPSSPGLSTDISTNGSGEA